MSIDINLLSVWWVGGVYICDQSDSNVIMHLHTFFVVNSAEQV